MPAKINHVHYTFEVQTSLGAESYIVEEGKIKSLNVDEAEWYQTAKVGDSVLCLNEETNEWTKQEIAFRNRRFDIQYFVRKSLNEESFFEYDPNDKYPNAALREKIRPSIEISESVEPNSPTSTPSSSAKKKSKKNRFNDSDESDEEEEEEESSESDDENDDMSQSLQSRSMSISPIDDLPTKIESILFRLKLPKSTRCWKDTFNHLTNEQSVHSKQEMDVDDCEEDKENVDANKQRDDDSMMIASEDGDVDKNEIKLVTKWLCKLWNRSYHHLEWLTLRELREYDAELKKTNYDKKYNIYDRRIKKINAAIHLKKYQSVHFFNELYLEIDRIVSYAEPGETFDTVNGYTSSSKLYQISTNNSEETMYLVKWKGLQYDAATWEMESFLKSPDFDSKFDGSAEIELLIHRQRIPPSKYLHPGPRKLNFHFFKNRPQKKERVADDETFKNGHKLRGNYQKDGVNWLIHNWQARVSCILADEMGLGKTVQTVTFINWLFTKYHVRGPFLIVAPLSTLGHWQREFRAWSDLNCIVYHGGASSRERMVAEEFEWLWTDSSHARARTAADLKKLNSNNFKFNVMITTPQIVNQDYGILDARHILWNTIIVDEAHSLKSSKSLFYRTLSTFKNQYTHTVLLTGTPIQNNMEELWCLLYFLDERQFPDKEEFVERFGNLAESKDELKEILKHRLLQRMKYVVEKDLAQREEKIIWVELTLFQKKWYKALYMKSYEKLKACGAAKASLMNVSMQLRKCCNHPFLMTDVEKTLSPPGTSEQTMNENLIASSGKLVLLDKLLPKLKREGHRVLIFSQMSHLLDILEDYLNFRLHLYERLDGSVTGADRQEAIDRFQKDDNIFCFLLTTRAGGVGINLMAADTVIIYDSDWNPMNDLQAVARCHRIGQKKQVKVYRLITRNCYEESMFKRADQKLALNKVVMGDMKDTSKSDINDMLKRGAMAMFLKDAQTDDDIKKFANADIDDILATRTEAVKHDAQTADPDAAMFSEAVFVAHADDADVNVDDENFWEVLGVGKEEEKDDAYTSPFMRRRGMRTRAYSSKSQSLDFYSEDDEEYEDVGTSLLGAISYIIYGQWQQIFADLSKDEKLHLGLIKEDEDDNEDVDALESNFNQKKLSKDEESKEFSVKDEENALQQWQIDILKQASVEIICKMINLMRPNMRNQKLGVDLKKLEHMLYEKDFRNDCLDTLAEQIYLDDMVKNDEWKRVIRAMWIERNITCTKDQIRVENYGKL